MAVFIIEPLVLLPAGFIAVMFLQNPVLSALVVLLLVGFRIWRNIVRMRRRAEERTYQRAVITLAQQQGRHDS